MLARRLSVVLAVLEHCFVMLRWRCFNCVFSIVVMLLDCRRSIDLALLKHCLSVGLALLQQCCVAPALRLNDRADSHIGFNVD